jgi:asparagine synthase (glutamine-hydrolysing)
MCGIAGIYNLRDQAPPAQERLERMLSVLTHRGPDERGTYGNRQIGLAHARLSIIDLTSGKQPIHNEDRTVWVIFNGEIFNYVELRAELVGFGHVFYTTSDTEVLVHLYEQYGEAFVNRLNGQFAVALWDDGRKRLLLFRDRVGIHPLFYTVRDGELIFASEAKAILAANKAAAELNVRALDQIFTFWAPVMPETIFKDIYQVPTGEMIVAAWGRLVPKRYWDYRFPEDDSYLDAPLEQQAEALRALLIDATRIRLRSDVPVGAYLSGGLDSSTITSIIHKHGDAELRTFSIGFEHEEVDETSFQQKLVDHLATQHSRVYCRNADVAAHFLPAIWHTESPILRTAPVPMKILSQHVREEGYKVVLTGEGADEVLGGYDIFKEGKIRQFWARNPASAWRPLLLKRLYPYLGLSQRTALPYLKAFFGAQMEDPDVYHFAHIPRWATTARCKGFFSEAVNAELRCTIIDDFVAGLPNVLARWHPFNRWQYIEAKGLMAGYLLCSQGDRMLMANAVEGRFPFLDHRVIEFASRVHPKNKMKALNEKFLLKRAMRDYLPESILMRPKQPYRAPGIAAFGGPDTPDFVRDLLSEASLRRAGIFDPNKVYRLLRKIQGGRAVGYRDNMAFVGVLSTQAWHHLFAENRGALAYHPPPVQAA